MTDEPENLTLRHLRALDAKLDQLSKDMRHGFETLTGHLVGLPPPAAVFARARALWDEHAAEVRPIVEAGWTATVSDWEFDRQPPETIERFLAMARAMLDDPI
jgi:hypothetical protein